MPTKLKLHRDEADLDPAAIPETYQFPVAGGGKAATGTKTAGFKQNPGAPAANSRTFPRAVRPLVAARVPGSPLVEVDRTLRTNGRGVTQGRPTPCAVVSDSDNDVCAGRIMNSKDLVREIESTLDRMQSRLDSFRRQVEFAEAAEAAIRFSDVGGSDDDNDHAPRPRAA